MANPQHIHTRTLPVQRSWLDKTCLCGLGDSKNSDHKHIGMHEFMYLCVYNTHVHKCIHVSVPAYTNRPGETTPVETGGSE